MIVGVIPTIIKVFAILFTNNFSNRNLNTTWGPPCPRSPTSFPSGAQPYRIISDKLQLLKTFTF